MENQNPNPEPKPTETPKEKWSFKNWWKSLWKKDENTEKKEDEPKDKKSNSWIWWLIGIIVVIIILLFVFANPFSSKDGKAKEKAKTEQTGTTTPTTPQITFSYDQSFEWSKLEQDVKDNLEAAKVTSKMDIDLKNVILKTEVKNYKTGETWIWLQTEAKKGKVKDIFIETRNINITL